MDDFQKFSNHASGLDGMPVVSTLVPCRDPFGDLMYQAWFSYVVLPWDGFRDWEA